MAKIYWDEIKAGDIISTKQHGEVGIFSIVIDNNLNATMETNKGTIAASTLFPVSKVGEFDVEETRAAMEIKAKQREAMQQPIEQAEISEYESPALTEALGATNALTAELLQNPQWSADRRGIVHMLKMYAAHRDPSITGEVVSSSYWTTPAHARISTPIPAVTEEALQALARRDFDSAIRLANEARAPRVVQSYNEGVGFAKDWATWMLHGAIFAVTGQRVQYDSDGSTIIPDDPRIAERAQEIIRLVANMIDEIDVKELASVDIAKRYGLAEATVRQAINRGQLRARKTGRDWMVKITEAERMWGGRNTEA